MADRKPIVVKDGMLMLSAQTTQYTVPANQKLSNIQTTLVNVSTGTELFDLWFVKAGQSVSDAYLIHRQKTLSSEQSYASPQTGIHTLDSSDFIVTQSQNNQTIAMRISGVLITLNTGT